MFPRGAYRADEKGTWSVWERVDVLTPTYLDLGTLAPAFRLGPICVTVV